MLEWVDRIVRPQKQTAVCLGFFDGVHIGHQALIKTTLQIAEERALIPYIHTYDRSPASVIHQGMTILELTNLEEKVHLFAQFGMSHVAVSVFDETLMHMSAEEFLDEVLIGRLNAGAIITGFNHRMGYQGKTTPRELRVLCDRRDLALHVVDAVRTSAGEMVSSTALRNAIISRDFVLAERMLGRSVPEKLLKAMDHHVEGV